MLPLSDGSGGDDGVGGCSAHATVAPALKAIATTSPHTNEMEYFLEIPDMAVFPCQFGQTVTGHAGAACAPKAWFRKRRGFESVKPPVALPEHGLFFSNRVRPGITAILGLN
jgi:hypothetical protein